MYSGISNQYVYHFPIGVISPVRYVGLKCSVDTKYFSSNLVRLMHIYYSSLSVF